MAAVMTETTENKEIPEMDFTKKWSRSDVTLQTQDSKHLIYANKDFLSIFSPFFEALFFGGFAESKQKTVKINIKFKVMLEILNILHHVERNFGKLANKAYSASELTDLYKAGEQFEIPLIRDMCKQLFFQIPARDAFEAAIELGLHKEKSEFLKKMSYNDVKMYLNKGIRDLVLSPTDTALILTKADPNFHSISSDQRDTQTENCTIEMKRETVDIDFTKKWARSDVTLQTKDSDQLLHANKNLLAVFSSYFNELLFSGSPESNQEPVKLDINFKAILETLQILHHIGRNFGNLTNKTYSASELADLYRAGDKLNIPLIRNMFLQGFDQIQPKDAFELAVELDLQDKKSKMLELMTIEEIDYYLNKGKNDLIFSSADAAVIVAKNRQKKCSQCVIYRHRASQIREARCPNYWCNRSNGYFICGSCNQGFNAQMITL